jgi:hypothetical protein
MQFSRVFTLFVLAALSEWAIAAPIAKEASATRELPLATTPE